MGMTVQRITSMQLEDKFRQLSSGRRINSAADDAAGLSIAVKMLAQEMGTAQGTANTADMSNLVKTAEGGLSGIQDSLQRVRELSVQAANDTLTGEDRQLIQHEVDSLLEGIGDMVRSTEFNKQKLLDGSFVNKHTASSADGSGKQISIDSMSVQQLGLQGYSVLGGAASVDLDALDAAISTVSTARSKLGAIENTFEHTMIANDITELNTAAARSRIYDADMAKALMGANKAQTMQQYQIFTQKERQNNQQRSVLSLLG
ncbi:MAG: flagellin [Clostridiales bacterium]|jgi:flagellin|nr:flagellin [Clostridiales bacterium]